MAFLDDIQQAGKTAGKTLWDVVETIASPVTGIAEQMGLQRLGAQLAAQEGNPIPMQLLQQQEQRNLLNQLVQQQMQPQSASAQAQPAFQLQKTPQLEAAVQSGDRLAFGKEVQRQQGLGNFELSVRSNKSLTDDDKATLISAKNSGVSVEDLYKLETQLMGKAETRQETLRKEKAALESQIAKEERAKVAAAEKKKAEVGAIDNFVNGLIAQNPALKSDPEALAIALATYPNLAKVKPEVRANIVEGLQKRGIISVPPSLLDRLIVNVEGLFSRKPAAPATSGFSIRKLE